MSKKKILTGWVHRLEDGVLVSYAPGTPAPDWVTNPKVLTTELHPETVAEVPVSVYELAVGAPAGDELDALDGKALKAIADDLGVAKNGKLDDIRDRIRAKRAENEPDEDEAHAALVEKAKELGLEVDENLTDVELQVLIEGA